MKNEKDEIITTAYIINITDNRLALYLPKYKIHYILKLFHNKLENIMEVRYESKKDLILKIIITNKHNGITTIYKLADQINIKMIVTFLSPKKINIQLV